MSQQDNGQTPKRKATTKDRVLPETNKKLLKHYPIIYNEEHESKLQARDKQNDDQDVDSPFPRNNNHLLYIIVGKRRSGKSTKIANALLNYYDKHFTDIYFFSPSARRDKKLKPIVDKCLENFTFYEEFNGDTIQEVTYDIEKNIKQWEELKQQYEQAKKDPLLRKSALPPEPVEPRHLLLLDDCVDKFGSHMDKSHPLVAICNNCFHKKLSIWVATQKFRYLLPAMRVNMDMITIFKCCNAQEKKAIEEEIGCPPKILKACYNDAMKTRYGDLHIHWIDGGLPKLFSRGSQFDIPEGDLLTFDDADDGEVLEIQDVPEVKVKKRRVNKISLLDEVQLGDGEGLEDIDKTLLSHAFPQ